MASASGTVITKKIFRSHKPYMLSQKAFKVAFAWNVFELERYGVSNFFTTDPLRNFLTRGPSCAKLMQRAVLKRNGTSLL